MVEYDPQFFNIPVALGVVLLSHLKTIKDCQPFAQQEREVDVLLLSHLIVERVQSNPL